MKKNLLTAAMIPVLTGLVAFAGMNVATPAGPSGPSGPAPVSQTAPVDAPTTISPNGIESGRSYKNDTSPALRDIPAQVNNVTGPPRVEREFPQITVPGQKDAPDAALQTSFGASNGGDATTPNAPIAGANFDGINAAGSGCNCAPPDTDGDVGPNHYVQAVNGAFAVYSKTGTRLYGPAAINTVWNGFGGACAANNDGDPVVLYDQFADRWLISQFTASSPYNECIAISQTADPLGAWNRYAFQLSTTDFPDYPHFGIAPDGYYMSVNWFKRGRTYAGPRPYVFNRAAMVAGTAATFQTTSAALGSGVAPIHPADVDGPTAPPAGTPGLFLGFGTTMPLYKFSVNWSNPAATTWAQSGSVTPAAYTRLSTAQKQLGTTQTLDTLGDRLMHRVSYRNMGTYQALIATHSVDAGSGKGGVRWYEIRNPAGTASIFQQGTYSPDSTERWMPGIAMDKNGGIGVGYSVASASLYPGIRYTGRLATDPAGTLGQGEGTMLNGSGFQNGVNRWGDYTTMSVDPADDCTFWFTTEYNNSGGWGWSTRIGSFKLSNCP